MSYAKEQTRCVRQLSSVELLQKDGDSLNLLGRGYFLKGRFIDQGGVNYRWLVELDGMDALSPESFDSLVIHIGKTHYMTAGDGIHGGVSVGNQRLCIPFAARGFLAHIAVLVEGLSDEQWAALESMQQQNNSRFGDPIDIVAALGSMSSDITGMTPVHAILPCEDVWQLIEAIDGDVKFHRFKQIAKHSISSMKRLAAAVQRR